MQIHEITSRRLDEGILGAIAGGLTKAVANQFVSSTLGIDPRTTPSTDPDARAKGAMEINKQLAVQLGQQLNKVWGQVTQNFMASHKDAAGNALTSMKTATPADAAKLKQELDGMVVDATKVGKPLDQWAASINTGDPKDANEAKAAVSQIKNIVDGIWKEALESSDTSGRVRASYFAELGQLIAKVQNIKQFMSSPEKTPAKPGERERVTYDEKTKKITVDGRPYNPDDPAQDALVKDFFARLPK